MEKVNMINNTIDKEYKKNLITAISFLFLTIMISFFSYDYLFYFVLVINIVYVLLFLFYRNPIYILNLFIFSIFFDINDIFTFGGNFHLRIWYVVSIMVLISVFLSTILNKKLFIIKKSYLGFVFFFAIITYFTVASILLNSNKIDAFLFVSKIYLFYFPIVIAFIKWADSKRILKIMLYFWFMTFWVSLFGIVQVASSVYSLPYFKYSSYLYEIRPHGFFSETTWLGYMAVVGIILGLYFYRLTSSKKYLLLSLPMLFIMLLSATRGAYLAFGVCILLLVFMEKNIKILVGLTTAVLISIYLAEYSLATTGFSLIEFTVNQFSLTDASAKGRLVAFYRSIEIIKENLLTGIGFGFSEVPEDSHSVIGSKAFNIFLMLFSSLGLVGFIGFILGLAIFIFNYIRRLKKSCYSNNLKHVTLQYGFILFVSFLVYSQNAPLHLHPFGWLILGITISIYANRNKGDSTP